MRLAPLFAAIAGFLGTISAPAAPSPAPRSDWRPIPAEERHETSPHDDAAPAITLLREVAVDTDLNATRFEYYIRIKVLTPQGVEELNKTEIPYLRDNPPRKLAAHVVKPDGRTIELPEKDFFNRDVIRDRRSALAVKAFAFPGLEPGDIAEYRYEVKYDFMEGARLPFDDPFPARCLRAKIRTTMPNGFGLRLQLIWSNQTGFKQLPRDAAGYTTFESYDLPASPTEPFPPPDAEAKRWLLYYFTFSTGQSRMYWSYFAGEVQALAEYYFKPTTKLKEAARKIVGDALLDREKRARLHEYCRKEIRNVSYGSSGYTIEQIGKLKKNKTATDTFTNGYGTHQQINLLFGALCHAAGLAPRIAYCGDRSQSLFDEKLCTRSALPDLLIAFGDEYTTYYDPGALYLAPGELQWKNEDTTAIVVRDKQWRHQTTPKTEPERSVIRRTAQLELAADGTLEGDLTFVYSGHHAFDAKHLHSAKPAEDSAKLVEKEIVRRLGPVEVTNCVLSGVNDPDAPVTVTCHVKASDYAEVVGRRLLVQPAFFQKGNPPTFPAEKRSFDVFFPYAQNEEDKVTIELPEGFELEPPRPLTTVTYNREFRYFPRFSLQEKGRRLVYERTYENGFYIVPVERYKTLRTLFHGVHARDSLVLSFQGPATGAGTP